ncbi:hypothetical protein WDZ92_42645, partial [Nostoc sp. NIES-2111]
MAAIANLTLPKSLACWGCPKYLHKKNSQRKYFMQVSGDVVLLITHSGDFFTIDRVAQALSKKGAQPFR